MEIVPLNTLAWQSLRGPQTSCGVFVHRVHHHAEIAEHDHLFHEIVYVESGTADHVTSEGRRKLRPGDVIVIRPQIWHAYRRTRQLDIINCLIDSRLMQRLGGLLSPVDGAFELYRQRPPRPRETAPTMLHAAPAQRSIVVERLESIMAEQREQRNGWQAAAVASLLDLLVIAARLSRHLHAAETLPHGASRADTAVAEAVGHLEDHFDQPVRLEEIARQVNLSPGHLCRSFRRRMGMGIVEFLHRTRVEEACRLLRHTAEPIGRIAARVGYSEIAYFSRCFRQQIGQSPRQYRAAWHGNS